MSDQVIVALVGGGALVVAALVGLVPALIGRRIGRPNGEGTVIEMLSKLLGLAESHDRRISAVEACNRRLVASVAEIRDAVRDRGDQ